MRGCYFALAPARRPAAIAPRGPMSQAPMAPAPRPFAAPRLAGAAPSRAASAPREAQNAPQRSVGVIGGCYSTSARFQRSA